MNNTTGHAHDETAWLQLARRLQKQQLQQLSQLGELASQLSALVHMLQCERGASNIFLCSGGQLYAAECRAGGALVDERLALFYASLERARTVAGSALCWRIARAVGDLLQLPALREQIARLMLDGGSTVSASDIVITNGCHGALSIALLSVCKPGDIVAVESPSFHGTMQMLRGFDIKAIEIPTDPETGISIEALELAMEQWPIKAVILVPNCNNPLGFIMPESRKKQVLALAQRHDIVIVEDDIYGELAAEYPRPRTIHSMDIDGRVLLCSSFTKTVAPGLRVGWIVPGRYYDRVMHMKYAAGGFNVPGTQMAVAAFIRDGHYHRHVRRMRQIYQQNMETYTCWVRQYFPAEICVTRPQGSFLLWVELPETVDMVCVSKQLCRLKIQAAAGSLFSASGKYRNCLRINVALPPTEKNREALRKMGEAIVIAMEE